MSASGVPDDKARAAIDDAVATLAHGEEGDGDDEETAPFDNSWGLRGLVFGYPGTNVEAAALFREYEAMLVLEGQIDTLSIAMSRITHVPTLELLGEEVKRLAHDFAQARPVSHTALSGEQYAAQRPRSDSRTPQHARTASLAGNDALRGSAPS